jgi:hypothetical protein
MNSAFRYSFEIDYSHILSLHSFGSNEAVLYIMLHGSIRLITHSWSLSFTLHPNTKHFNLPLAIYDQSPIHRILLHFKTGVLK